MFRRLLRLARSRRLALTLTVLLGWIGGLLVILQAWFLSRIVDGVFLGGQTLAAVLPLLEILLIVILLRAAGLWGAELTANAVALHVKANLRARLLQSLAALGPAFTQGEKTGELAAAAIEGVEALDAWFGQYLPQVALAACIPLSILLLVFPLDPLTGLVFLLTAPLIPLFMYLIGKTAEALTQRQWETLGRLSAYLLDVLQGLVTLKLLGQSRRQAEGIQQASDRFRDVTLGVLRVTFLSALALELLATLGTAIVAVEIGLRLLYAQMNFQQALFILVLAPDFYLPLRMLGQRFHAGMTGVSAARRIFEILDTPVPRLQVGTFISSHVPTFQRSNVPTSNISFSNVSYSYPTRHLPALENVSFDIPAGQMTALVGATGAGKSTVASLLLRFIEPGAGEIRVGGAPLAAILPEEWRARLAYVPQSPYLFNDTLAANLRLAKPEAGDEELARACQRADLHEFILSLPEGYATPIGERGARLSGGQAQRLALARAFLRDAPFLILDESTSSLDPAQEARLSQAVRELMRGRTTLVIAHRLATVARADQILVLASGRLAETGAHADLLQRHGPYARLLSAHHFPPLTEH
jgi:thiol reductant ABC exporter CydD subunit